MERVTLPTTPTELSPVYEVRDYKEGDAYARLVFRLDNQVDGHIVVSAQAFELNAEGVLQQASIGIPSRTPSSNHTVHSTAFTNKQVAMNDFWGKTASDYDPVAGPGDAAQGEGPPTEDGTEFGDRYFDTVAEQMWEWKQGWLDVLAIDKFTELQAILATSNIVSGVGFR